MSGSTAPMMIAASVAFGRSAKNSVSRMIVRITKPTLRSPASCEVCPARSATDVRDMPASTGKPCASPAATFDAPTAMSSRFGSTS